MENTLKVFVLNMRGQPLMPCSPPKARKLLRAGKAVPVRRTPFVIQLTVPTGETKQPITLGVDAGYKHVGLSATTAKEELLASEVELRQDVTGLLSDRLALRRARRNRKTRCRAPRFDNRVRSKHKGWLAPSVENRIQAHISRIEAVCRVLPITKIVIETASFDIQKIKNPEVEGTDYQQAEQLGFWNVREYVLFRDGHVCQACKGRSKDLILNVHHIESRKTGSDAPGNLITLWEACHKAYHAGKLTQFSPRRGASFRAETFMGLMRWTVLNRLRERHQAPHLVHGFRLFDKVLCKGEVGFIFGRRSSGAFDVRCLDGTKISAGISYKKLSLLEKRKMFLTELRKEGRDSSRV